jgi:hypothetical protein
LATLVAILLVLSGIGPGLFLVLWLASRKNSAVRERLRGLYEALPDRQRNRIEQTPVLHRLKRALLQD